MSFQEALLNITSNAESINLGSSTVLQRQLSNIIKIGGILPTSPTLIQRLRSFQFSDKSTNKALVDVLQCDPILCLRLFALCNNTYYLRGNVVQDLDGVINRLGLMRMAEVASDLAEVKAYNRIFSGRAIASAVFQQGMLAGIIASRIYNLQSEQRANSHAAFMVGALYNIWLALFAYLKPNIYAGVLLDTFVSSKLSLEKNVKKVAGKSVPILGSELLEEIGLPKEFVTMLSMLDVPPWLRRSWQIRSTDHSRSVISSAYIANRIANEIHSFRDKNDLMRLLKEMASKNNMRVEILNESLSGVAKEYFNYVSMLDLSVFRLPNYILDFDEEIVERDGQISTDGVQWSSISQRIKPFVYELKACFRTIPKEKEFHRTPQVVYSTLLALVRGMDFDRAVYFQHNEEERFFAPVLLYGLEVEDLESHLRYISGVGRHHMPDIQAYTERRAVFNGDPIFEDSWPFVAFPVVWANKVQGIFYADKKEHAKSLPLSTAEQVAAIALAEEWLQVKDEFY